MLKQNVTANLFPVEKAAIVAYSKAANLSETNVVNTLLRLGLEKLKDIKVSEFRLLSIEVQAKAAAEQCISDSVSSLKYHPMS